jgi:hypothetical protein
LPGSVPTDLFAWTRRSDASTRLRPSRRQARPDDVDGDT